MSRQLLCSIILTFFTSLGLAKPPADNTYTVPPAEKSETEAANYVAHPAAGPGEYHLLPNPSVTLAYSPVYDFSEEENSNWGGIYVSPWMDATHRAQVGVDLRSDTTWWHAVFHILPSRNRFRFYYGGGVSVMVNSEAHLKPVFRIENYYLMGVGGWEAQVQENSSVRIEAGYHQGTDDHFLKGVLGYTYHF